MSIPHGGTTHDVLRRVPWLGPPLAALADRRRGVGEGERAIIFYDGECVMCNHIVQLLLRIGMPGHFRFASQQGSTWQALVEEKPYLRGVDSIVVLSERDAQRTVRLRSEAVLWLLTQLRLPYALAWIAMWIPLPLSDVAYRLIARFRKRVLGELPPGACPIPPQAFRDRFLD